MGFLGVYTAVYDYQPQAENELEITEGDLLYVLEKSSEDDWWKAKKKAAAEDDDEPVGLVPNNYVEEARPIHKARALYDYTRQTDEEVSFSEDVELMVYDASDPDWTLVGVNAEYGFAPANYIEVIGDGTTPDTALTAPSPPALPERPVETESEGVPTPKSPSSPVQGPAAALAGILQHQASTSSNQQTAASPPATTLPPRRPIYTPEESEEEDAAPPALPRRPPSQQMSPPKEVSAQEQGSPPSDHSPPRTQYASSREDNIPSPQISPDYHKVARRDTSVGQSSVVLPSGYHMYNISEMVTVMGKRKKMPTTLGINITTGTIFISPEKSTDGPHQEWTADKLMHYSIEGKHVFLDLVRPSKNVDFHAGAKDTAEEIVSALGEISGGYKAEGLREVIAAGAGGAHKSGQVLYDFMAQGDDEVTVAVGDEVVILDDTKSDEWWMVRREKNGKEGVVPSSYVEITGVKVTTEPTVSTMNAGLSTVEQNRLEEARLTKESARKSKSRDSNDARVGEVGPGMKLPERGSSLVAREDGNQRSQRHKRDNKSDGKSSKPKPDPSKTRKWTDRSGTFTVVAQFIGLNDGKIHLHKQNGVKIAVPVAKMSIEDLEYVERATGQSLEEDKPLSDIRRRSQLSNNASKVVGASVISPPEYDWFDFFLKAGVGPHQCERYAQNFAKDSMDESVLPDITPEVLRTLGLKEGDIIRVMRHLDNQFGRAGAKAKMRNVSFGGEEVIGNGDEQADGSLFSGPGGALRNNTRKGRPVPPVQTSDVVDPKAFQTKGSVANLSEALSPGGNTPPQVSSPVKDKDGPQGFEDNAWEVKPPNQQAPSSASSTPVPQAAPVSQHQPALTGAMADLSLLQAPLQPAIAHPAPAPKPSQPLPQQLAQVPQPQQPQPPGATPSFFAQLGQQSQPGQNMPQPPPIQRFNTQPTAYVLQQPTMPSRQRPQPPPTMNSSSLLPPPPPRPLSAPQNLPQPSSFGLPPLQPQLTATPISTPPIAPLPGQGLTELNQQRFQHQLNQQPMLPQPSGYGPQGSAIRQFGSSLGIQQQPQLGFQTSQPFMNGQQQNPGAFSDPRSPGQQLGFQSLPLQPAGFQGFSQAPQQQPMMTGSINSILPPALQPQPSPVNGLGGNTVFGRPPPVPPILQQPTIAPLQPQKTGPPPQVRFGVRHEAKKLAPQPTGLRANLAQATPSNPFGF